MSLCADACACVRVFVCYHYHCYCCFCHLTFSWAPIYANAIHAHNSPVIWNCVLDLVKCYAINTWRIKFGIRWKPHCFKCVCGLVVSIFEAVSTSFVYSLWHTQIFYFSKEKYPMRKACVKFSVVKIYGQFNHFMTCNTICSQICFDDLQ